MKCSKCGCDNYSGHYCQNCGEQFKLPTWVTIMTVVNFLLMWVMGIACMSMGFMCKTYLKQGDLVKYQKYLNGFKIMSIVGVVLGIILNIAYVYLKSMMV
jgi:hypothetical protein